MHRRTLDGAVEFISGLLAGLTLGFAAALLLAPREGSVARSELHDQAEHLRHRPRELVGEVQARLEHAVQEGRLAAAEMRAELEASAGLGAGESGV
jgi:gas vesicle protein